MMHYKNSANITQSVDFILKDSILTIQQRIQAFKSLGQFLSYPDQILNDLINTAHLFNPWFTAVEVSKALKAWAQQLSDENLNRWLSQISSNKSPKIVGLVLAGNIPMVGFHDILAVLATGHIALIKVSSQDKQLIPHILARLVEIEPAFRKQIEYTERLEKFDAVIATGSNNTARYFEFYFKKVPHIIRKNRNSIAILSGNESTDQLSDFGRDLFDYYGLGCRNVSKVFVPADYNFTKFFESIEQFNTIVNHNKYCNNYEYNKSIYLINSDKHYDNGFLLVKEDERLASPLAVLYYEEYTVISDLEERLEMISENVQCVVTTMNVNTPNQKVGFSISQQPNLWDYADGINTLDFLLSL